MFLKSNNENSLYLDKLVSENCLLLGQKCGSKTNNEKNYFVLGRRSSIEVLNKNKMKFMLFRLYPIISGFYRAGIGKSDVKILFATTSTIYKKIVEEAAIQCGMPFYSDRWLCGSITGTLQNAELNRVFNIKKTREELYTDKFYRKTYKSEIDIKKLQYSFDNRWVSLAVIPDVQNNAMILRELKKSYIPTAGIVDMNTTNNVTYPVFGNNTSLYAVSFFCNLLSKIISSEKSLFSLKKKYQVTSGRKSKNLKKKIITIKGGDGYFFYRRKKKNYKTFWKFLRTYVFPQKKTPKFVKKIIKRKLNVKSYYKKKILNLSLKEKGTLNKKNNASIKVIEVKKLSTKLPFFYFTKKDFVMSMAISKKRTNLRRLFKSITFLKSQNTLRMWSNKNSWLVNEKTKPRFLPISKKLFFGFKKLKKKKQNSKKKLRKLIKLNKKQTLRTYIRAKKRNLIVFHYLRKQLVLKSRSEVFRRKNKKLLLELKNKNIKAVLYIMLESNPSMKYYYFSYLKFFSQKGRIKLWKSLNLPTGERSSKEVKVMSKLYKKYVYFLKKNLKI